MEIKAELLKPYTENQRIDFIVEQNHRLGYEIRETETALEAWGYTDEEIIAQREAEFNVEFFQTSLGYIRRSVTMANGSHKDFLSDLLPAISASVQMGQTVNIIAYDKPDFTEEVTDWTEYQNIVAVTPQFIQECFIQLGNDFLPINEE